MTRPAVIDADGHIIERQQDIRQYLPAPYDRRPTQLFQLDHPWDTTHFQTLGYRDYPEHGSTTPEQQIEFWLKMMDEQNIETAVLFPTISGTVNKLVEPGFAAAVARAANDHFARDFAAKSSRLKPVGVLPLRHPQLAVEELRRATKEHGFVGFELLTAGLSIGLGNPVYDDLWAEAERLGVAMCVHGSRSFSWEVGGDRLQTFSEVHCYAFPAAMLLHFTSIFFNGIPARFPRLKLAFLEIGATWLPYYLDRMDEHYEKRAAETPNLTMKPSDMFRQSTVCVSLESGESLLPQTLEQLGDEHFMWASDVPHWDSEFPENLEQLWERPDLSEQTKRRLLYENAKRLYGL